MAAASVTRYYATGKRKNSIARVWLMPGNGKITINDRAEDRYFGRDVLKMIIRQPLALTETMDKFDLYVMVRGGGYSGQAGALRHGISRALVEFNPERDVVGVTAMLAAKLTKEIVARLLGTD